MQKKLQKQDENAEKAVSMIVRLLTISLVASF